MRRATRVTLQLHQILRLPRKMILMVDTCNSTSFTMRGATRVTLQLHQILRLPRKKILMIDPTHVWNVIYNKRSNKSHPPTSPNTAPATKKDSHDRSCSHNETSFAISGATALTLQCHQILRQPCHMTRMIVARHIWNVIYNMRSNRHHPPTSSNTAPATLGVQNLREICRKRLKRNLRSDSTMIRTWNCKTEPARSPRLLPPPPATHFVLRITAFRALAIQISPNAAPPQKMTLQDHEMVRLPRKMTFMIWCAEQQVSPSNSTKYCACHAK